jgi:hypothetical protein
MLLHILCKAQNFNVFLIAFFLLGQLIYRCINTSYQMYLEKRMPYMPPRPITENTLCYSDNLDILREYIAAESVDLIHLDHLLADWKHA